MKLDREQLELFYQMRLRRAMIFSQALTALAVGVSGDLNARSEFVENLLETRTVLVYFEALLSCYSDELGMLQDMSFAVAELTDSVNFELFEISSSNVQETFPAPRISGNAFCVKVTLPLPKRTLPANAKITCQTVALLFNIGINEQATLAETFGLVKLQDDMNKASFYKLEKFIANQANVDSSELIDQLAALKFELYSNRAKNVRILTIMEDIARSLHMVRFTSCKSAKDRTAMAVTLEEARHAFRHNPNVSEQTHTDLFQKVLRRISLSPVLMFCPTLYVRSSTCSDRTARDARMRAKISALRNTRSMPCS